MNQAFNKPNTAVRQSNFELLRIFAMLMIVASHWGWWSSGVPTILKSQSQQIFYTYFRTFGQVGVIIFVLLSGYFLCKSKFKVVALIKILAQVFFYIIFLLAVFYLRGYIKTGVMPSLGLKALANWFIPISTGRWWFFSCYVAMYLLSPFLNKMIERLKKNEFRILLAILFLFLSVFPSFFVYTTANDALQNIIIFIFIYFIGAYIRLFQEDFQNKALCFGGALLSLLIFVVGKKYGLVEFRYWLQVIVLSVFIFLTFMHLNVKSKWINTCAKTTFGVYLLHENTVVTFWLWNNIFLIQKVANTAWFIPVSILSVVVTFIVCGLVDYARQLFFEPLLLKLLNKEKIKKYLIKIDETMPASVIEQKENTRGDNRPMVVLLIADMLFLGSKIIAFYAQKNIPYMLFLAFQSFVFWLCLQIKRLRANK